MIDTIKKVVDNELCINDIDAFFIDRVISCAYNLIEELTYDIKIGDYVEFKHFDNVIKGFIEETRYEYRHDNESITNIEKTQFCHENSWGNYVHKGISLKFIKENLITYKASELCNELLLDLHTLKAFLDIVNINKAKAS